MGEVREPDLVWENLGGREERLRMRITPAKDGSPSLLTLASSKGVQSEWVLIGSVADE